MTRELQDGKELPKDWETTAGLFRSVGERVLGVTAGKQRNGKETWWWNEEVQKNVKEKKGAKRA